MKKSKCEIEQIIQKIKIDEKALSRYPNCVELIKIIKDEMFFLNQYNYVDEYQWNIICLAMKDGSYQFRKLNQIDLIELVISNYFKDGLNLLNKNEVMRFLAILNDLFCSKFKNYSRKSIGSKIRQSKRLISIAQGKYISDTNLRITKNEIEFCFKYIEHSICINHSIEADYIYYHFEERMTDIGIDNPHMMFSILKYYFSNEKKHFIFYRNTFKMKFIYIE